MQRLSLYFFGAPRIERDGKPVSVDTRKAIALLAYLILSEGSHTRDTLAALFWPEADQSRARAALRRTLSTLKSAIGGVGLDIEREALRLEEARGIWIDVHEFQERIKDAGEHPHNCGEECPDCLASLQRAAELYRGDFLEGFGLRDSPGFDDWQFFQAEGLRRQFAVALERLACGYSSRGEFEPAIAFARRWVAVDPLREEAHRRLMQLYARAGQRSAALRQYRECTRILEQELGVSPLDETTGLYHAILESKSAGSEEEGKTPINLPQKRNPGTQEVVRTNQGFDISAGQDTNLPRSPASALPLVGRSQESVELLRAYEKAAGGYFLALEGEPGIGKTRLAEEFLVYARSRGALAVSGRSYEGEAELVYGPFIEALRAALKLSGSASRLKKIAPHWLAEGARLLPELAAHFPGLPATPHLDRPGAQSHFLEGLAQILFSLLVGDTVNSLPGILFLDDLHWADEASQNLLAYLVRRLRGHPLFILGTWRKEGMAFDHPLLPLIASVQRDGIGSVLALSRLRPHHIADLVQAVASTGVALPAGLEERLFSEAEGLPFFVVEYLASLVEGTNSGAGAWTMPHNVRDLLRVRLTAVNDTGGQLLTTAAVIGRSFDFETLRRASGRSETETVTGLEGLIAQGLILEHGGDQELASSTPHPDSAFYDKIAAAVPVYDFSHEKLRALVYEETSLARRRLLHRRVAEALAEGIRQHANMGASAGQIARHFQLAGQPALAAEYFKAAGEYARSLYANTEALAYFQAALAAGHPRAIDLYEAVGDLYTLLGLYNAALKNYEKAASICEVDCLARLEHKLGDLHHRRGEWELAEVHYQAAFEALGQDDEPDQPARLYADWARTAFQRSDPERALELAQQAMDLAERAAEPRALAQVHNMLGILARNREDFATAIHHLEKSLALAESLGDMSARVAALNNLALAYGDQGRTEPALAQAEKALQLCAQQGDRHREAALHNNLADLLHRQGRSEEAMGHLKQAVTIFAEIGEVDAHQALDTASAEIWKLTEW